MNEKQKQLFDMNCGETMIGFVQKKGSHKTQCFYGKKNEVTKLKSLEIFDQEQEAVADPGQMVQLPPTQDEYVTADESQNEEAAMEELVKKKQAKEELDKWRVKYSKTSDIPDSEIPSSFDLRHINGFNFAGKIRD